jgi:hypothetical protein
MTHDRRELSRQRCRHYLPRHSLVTLSLVAACSGSSDEPMTGFAPRAGVGPQASSAGAGSAAPEGPRGAHTTPEPTSMQSMPSASGSGAGGRSGLAPMPQSAGSNAQQVAEPSQGTPAGGRGVDGKIVSDCQGLKLEGLVYSPGGEVLPNKCAPFDPTTNNPYAVRCIDALPHYATMYPGDNFCILPPPPDAGVQFGVHPQRGSFWEKIAARDLSGYSQRDLVADYELSPGDEQLQVYDTTASLPDDKHFYRIDFRARIGSHHSVTRFRHSPAVSNEGWVANEDSFNSAGTPLADIQRASFDVPVSTLHVPDDEAGIGIKAPGRTSVSFQLHHFNASDSPILREVWLNVWYMRDEDVKRSAVHCSGVGSVNYPPNAVTNTGGTVTAGEPIKLLSLFGHRHAWTSSFNVWLSRAGATTEDLIYSSNSWEETPTYAYNSATKNPAPNEQAGTDGAFSGPLDLAAGDALRFNCRGEVTPERAAEIGVPLPTQPLRFANEAFTGEMCVLGITATGKFVGAF